MRRVQRLEQSVETSVANRAAAYGIPSIKLGREGWPDRLFLIPGGYALFVEYKRPGEIPEDLQLYRHQILRQLGYEVAIHDNVDISLNSILQRLEDNMPSGHHNGYLTGDQHPSWKGDKASIKTQNNRGREHAKKTIPILGPCEDCGTTSKRRERHHIDDNTNNNQRDNLATLCTRCHMIRDGRLKQLSQRMQRYKNVWKGKRTKSSITRELLDKGYTDKAIQQALDAEFGYKKCHANYGAFCRYRIPRV